jgi:hypothetical protein
MMSRQAADENRSDVVVEGRDRIAEGGSCARSLAPGSGRDRHRRRRQGDNCRPSCVLRRCEWTRCGDAVVVDGIRKVLEGEVRLSGGCLFSSRAVKNDAGAIAKSRGSRASATREGALASVGFLAGGLG